MVKDVCPLPGAGQNCHFPLLPTCPKGEVAKGLPVVRLATTLADKHKATVLPNCVLGRCSQRLESLVTYITGVNPLSLVCFVHPH